MQYREKITPRILVVDDDANFRKLLMNILERKKHGILEAENGEEACRLVQDNELPLAIIDISMPGMGGLETIKEIRKASPDTKIIAISGSGLFGPAENLSIAREFGARHAFEKPFSIPEFLSVVQYFLGVEDKAPAHG